jgi:hypothetical protein
MITRTLSLSLGYQVLFYLPVKNRSRPRFANPITKIVIRPMSRPRLDN